MRARRRENDYKDENDFFRDGAMGGLAAGEQGTEAGGRPSAPRGRQGKRVGVNALHLEAPGGRALLF